MLSDAAIQGFIRDGHVRIENAFPRRLATQGRARIWRDLPEARTDTATWTRPVARFAVYWQKPFRDAANTPRLHAAYDQLVGRGRWRAPEGLGAFIVRFPSDEDPSDTGWHIDSSFPPADFDGVIDETTDFGQWRVNIASRDRALLMLFLFSDVDEDDAPTRIRIGSHVDTARMLAPHGEAGLAGADMAVAAGEGRPEALATGPAGTVYLCHPFLVHAAQPHRGSTPRFLAQPGLAPAGPPTLERGDAASSPVETAIRRALT